ncbi:MAG TPA: zf-HC2 domain-containing protein [Clostridia bacterium]|nr:zf-HC2 domain-containing protein [Clostridia bacterium]
MNSRHFDEYISPYLDKMTDEKDKRELEAHLSGCSKCKIVLDETRGIINNLKGLDDKTLPLNFHEGLFDRLDKSKNSMRNRVWLKTAGAIVATVILLFTVKAIGNWSALDGDPDIEEPQQESDQLKDSSMLAMDEEAEGEHIEDSGAKTMNEEMQSNASKEDFRVVDRMGIQSESVEVYVEDICITPQTLQFMAVSNELELVHMDENSATFEMLNDEQRILLYEELSKMGNVIEVGETVGGDRVKVVIKSITDKTDDN